MDAERNLSEMMQDGTLQRAMEIFVGRTLRKEEANRPLTIEAVVCQPAGMFFKENISLFLARMNQRL